MSAQDLLQVGVHAQPEAAEQASHGLAGPEHLLVDQQRQHEPPSPEGWQRAAGH